MVSNVSSLLLRRKMVFEPSEMRTVISGDDQVKMPNPAILTILDPLHRSLLSNNLQYDQGK